MPHLKICIVSDGPLLSVYGGGQVYCRNLVDGLAALREKFELSISVISPQVVDGVESPFRYHDVCVYPCDKEDDYRRVFLKIKPDIVHANGAYLVVSKICNELRIKVVATIHDSRWMCPQTTYLPPNGELCDKATSIKQCLKCELSQIRLGRFSYPIMRFIPIQSYLALGRFLEQQPFVYYLTPVGEAALKLKRKMDQWKEICDSMDGIIQISSRMVDMSRKNGLSENKIYKVINGVPSNNNEIPFPDTNSTIKFFYTGRVCFSKGVHLLLKAFHSIQSSNAELHIIGSGDKYYTKLKKKYSRDTRIIWHGQVAHEEVLNLIHDYHVMVHPSIGAEACSLSILESLSLGKVVICTNCGGPSDLVTEGVNGWIVPPNNLPELREKMIDYIKSPKPPSDLIYVDMNSHIKNVYSVYCDVLNK